MDPGLFQDNCRSGPDGCLEAMTVGVLVTCNVGCENNVSVLLGLRVLMPK